MWWKFSKITKLLKKSFTATFQSFLKTTKVCYSISLETTPVKKTPIVDRNTIMVKETTMSIGHPKERNPRSKSEIKVRQGLKRWKKVASSVEHFLLVSPFVKWKSRLQLEPQGPHLLSSIHRWSLLSKTSSPKLRKRKPQRQERLALWIWTNSQQGIRAVCPICNQWKSFAISCCAMTLSSSNTSTRLCSSPFLTLISCERAWYQLWPRY